MKYKLRLAARSRAIDVPMQMLKRILDVVCQLNFLSLRGVIVDVLLKLCAILKYSASVRLSCNISSELDTVDLETERPA